MPIAPSLITCQSSEILSNKSDFLRQSRKSEFLSSSQTLRQGLKPSTSSGNRLALDRDISLTYGDGFDDAAILETDRPRKASRPHDAQPSCPTTAH
jgi:hypothetical protein